MKRAWSSPSSPGSRGVTSSNGIRQDRDAVEGLLAVHGDIVAERLERLAREGLVDAFGFLQADDVGLRSASQAVALSIRCLIELTFQVAMRIADTLSRRPGAQKCTPNAAIYVVFAGVRSVYSVMVDMIEDLQNKRQRIAQFGWTIENRELGHVL